MITVDGQLVADQMPAAGWDDTLTTPVDSIADRLVLTAMRAQVEEIGRIATATGDALGRLLDPSAGSPALGDALRRSIPRWHFAMLNDRERNDALAVALERRIRPGSHVLDIGSGTGLLAMMAVRAGAAHVTTCETNPVMAEIARQVIAQHGMADVITVVPKRSLDLVVGVDLQRRVDFLVSEIVDCGLIGEGLLPTIAHAREHLLAPDGEMLPVAGRILGFLVDSPAILNLNRTTTAGGFDVRRLNAVATEGHFPVRLSTWPHRVLTDAVELASFDLVDGSLGDGSAVVVLPVLASGTAHGVVAWFEMDLGAGVVIRNSPDNVVSHWMQALVPFDQPIDVVAGTAASVELSWAADRLSVSAHRSPEN
jgi:SAM-dependent methyltransferase